MTLTPELLAKIKLHAAAEAALDDADFNPCESSGGNYDDAHEMGVRDGYILFAREILRALGE